MAHRWIWTHSKFNNRMVWRCDKCHTVSNTETRPSPKALTFYDIYSMRMNCEEIIAASVMDA